MCPTVSVTSLTVGEVGRDVPPAATPYVSTWVDPPDSFVPDDVHHGMEVSVSSTVPGLRLQNRFSPLDEPIDVLFVTSVTSPTVPKQSQSPQGGIVQEV